MPIDSDGTSSEAHLGDGPWRLGTWRSSSRQLRRVGVPLSAPACSRCPSVPPPHRSAPEVPPKLLLPKLGPPAESPRRAAPAGLEPRLSSFLLVVFSCRGPSCKKMRQIMFGLPMWLTALHALNLADPCGDIGMQTQVSLQKEVNRRTTRADRILLPSPAGESHPGINDRPSGRRASFDNTPDVLWLPLRAPARYTCTSNIMNLECQSPLQVQSSHKTHKIPASPSSDRF